METLKELESKLAELKTARHLAEEAQNRYEILTSAPLIKEARAAVQELGAAALQKEQEVRALTLKAYQETGDKKPVIGAGIRVIREIRYLPAVALAWCKENFVAALTLDKKTFERYALESATPPEFVTITEEPQATIAREL